VTQVHQP